MYLPTQQQARLYTGLAVGIQYNYTVKKYKYQAEYM